MERFRIEVGHKHEVQPGNIVGAIANEAGLDAEHIGHIDIHDDFSLVDLPLGMPKDVFRDLKKTWVCGQRINISRLKSKASGEKDQGARKRASSADNKSPSGGKKSRSAGGRKPGTEKKSSGSGKKKKKKQDTG